jgi:hypothetical protein
MNALIERERSTTRDVRSSWGGGLVEHQIVISGQTGAGGARHAERDGYLRVIARGPSTVMARLGWAVHRASESVISTVFAGVLLALSVAFTALMIMAVAIVLTCGLACYA